MGRAAGLTTEELAGVPRFEDSAALGDLERLVLRLAVAMSSTPANVPEPLYAELHRRFDEAQLVELTAAIAWENFRSRFNRCFEVEPQGFDEGAACVVPGA